MYLRTLEPFLYFFDREINLIFFNVHVETKNTIDGTHDAVALCPIWIGNVGEDLEFLTHFWW